MEASFNSSKKMCPSYIGKVGAQLFGVVNKDGKVQFITPLTVTEDFLELNKDQNSLEQRFRFTGKCVEKGCAQWNNEESKCSLSQKVQNFNTNQQAELFFCPIRSQCRWFFQDGKEACFSCNEITRNMEELLLNLE
ncbi:MULTISPECIES: hypothetical protein [Chryseobacterium]|uniref:Uncharacterized protein n=1 Tax=Chryseobacterium geocarposphaerae TaxID=1416776 RepID=A0ABU1LEC5_9FLAO|nr:MULTISPECIES: hypothetical protein [Chryseobacterium]MDR6405064.1 hypothetical protein [Chryseobacterium geocarposphaerae]MDR6697847.1 hypothetical protein [Chryseobacterium ginsenosidimutans]